MPSQLMSAPSHVHNCSLSVFYIKADHPTGPDPQESAMPTFKRNPLLHVALLTAGASLWHPAPASAQATLQFDAAIPPGITEELKRYGIELPQDRVKGAVHIQQGADGTLDVRFNQTADTPEPKQAVRGETQEPAAAATLPSPPAPPKSSEPPSGQARSEAPITQ